MNVASTPDQPIHIGDGFHCSDLSVASGLADPTILAVQQAALASMKVWLADWKPSVASGGGDGARIHVGISLSEGRSTPAPSKPISAWNIGAGRVESQ